MLDIDYSLVPMTSEDRRLVQEEVDLRVENDEIPPPERSVNGRVILLNPDPVQTIHQISDELRPRLRRVMMPTQEGSNHLSAEQLFQHISDSDERLYLIIIELQSEFRSLSTFLDYLPRLRRDYPELSIFLSGSLLHLREKFSAVLAGGKSALVLEYPGGEDPVEFTDAEDFNKRVSTREQEVSLSTPFFTEIRLNLDGSGRSVSMTLLTLRKLQSVLGHGEPQTVEVGRGRKERMIVIDLPIGIIQDFRFRQDRGLEFLGVVIKGATVQSRDFGDEKLEFRWVPMKAIDAFLRRNAMGAQERIDMKQVGVMRVNTLTGQISFIMKDTHRKISLDGARKIGFRKVLHGKAIQGLELPENEQNGTLIPFDRIIQPSTTSALNDPMQEAVKVHFYHKLIGEEVEQTRKSEIYAQRLHVAGVGPLAAQTLKLLRRFGLERVIDEESFYYLCDTPEEIPTHTETQERYNEHFSSLISLMRDMAFGQPSERIRVSDIAYNLPISTEWIDTGLASYPKVTNQELEAVYHEMQMLLNFITHEFRRNFDIQKEDMVFFQKIQNCRDAGLLAKWLAEFKRGAYGKMLPEGQHPDVLFFANDEEKKENDQRYFFPSLSCAELFKNQQNKDLFSDFDYDFSVFLEEQLALAIHHAREEGNLQPKAEDLDHYFNGKVEEAKGELEELNEALAAVDDTGSEIYQKMLQEEEETYRRQFEDFKHDQEGVDNQLKENTAKLDALVGELKSQLHRGGASESEFFASQPGNPEALEQRILAGASRTETQLQEGLHSGYAGMMEEVNSWLQHLTRFSGQLRRFHQFHHAWQTAKEQLHIAGLGPAWKEKLQGRFQFVQRMKAMEREHHTKRVESQVQNYKNEIGQTDTQLRTFGQQIQQALATLKHYMAIAGSRVDLLGKLDSSVDPAKIVAQAEMLRKVLIEISKNSHTLSLRSKEVQENVEKTRIRKIRHLEHFFQLRVEESVLKAVAENSEPTLPMPPKTGDTPPSEEEAGRLKSEWEKHRTNLEIVRNDLLGAVKKVEGLLLAVKGQAAEFHRFKEKHENLVRLTARKKRLRDSANGLSERMEMMEKEMADLPEQVKKYFMPARKKLLIELFIPEVERKISMFGKAQIFLVEMMSLSYEQLKKTYLDHAIFRRFHARQFLRGGAYAPDQASPLHHGMRNVQSALRMTLRAFQHNYKRHNMRGAERLTIPQLSYKSTREIMASVENMATSKAPNQFDYLVLPPTTPLMEGLNMMIRKDRMFHGIPRLVMIFITRFDGTLLRRDDAVREAYFKALKHNVVINVDGHTVVDNPRSIAMRLLQETLGCCIDIPDIEEPSEVASDAVD